MAFCEWADSIRSACAALAPGKSDEKRHDWGIRHAGSPIAQSNSPVICQGRSRLFGSLVAEVERALAHKACRQPRSGWPPPGCSSPRRRAERRFCPRRDPARDAAVATPHRRRMPATRALPFRVTVEALGPTYGFAGSRPDGDEGGAGRANTSLSGRRRAGLAMSSVAGGPASSLETISKPSTT